MAQKYLKVMKSPIPPHFFCRYIFWQWVNCLSMHQNVNELKLGNLEMLIKLRGKDDHGKENLFHQKETLTLLSHTVMKTPSLLMRHKKHSFQLKVTKSADDAKTHSFQFKVGPDACSEPLGAVSPGSSPSSSPSSSSMSSEEEADIWTRCYVQKVT